MAKIDKINPKWFGKSIYRYHLRSSESKYSYRFVSTEITPIQAIEIMRDHIPPNGAYRLFCNGQQIYNYSARKNRGVINKKTGDTWKNIVEFCIDNGYTRKKAQEVIRRKTDIYEYIYFDN